ncbi:hypothetical protein AKO1_002668 [Acrasis kona]|uniref:Non-homologous end-joining factor 1 n=1 Tax=Acrasis kona TaxID=1008807 RepID=A0AAW2ZME0_9EUKA
MDESLLTTRWHRLKVDTDVEYFIKFANNDDSYFILVTDLLSVWESKSGEDQVKKDIDVYCPQLSMNTPDLINRIRSYLINEDEDANCKLSIHKDELEEIIIAIDSSLLLQAQVSIPFKWRILCNPAGRTQKTQGSGTDRPKKRRRGDHEAILIEDEESDLVNSIHEEKMEQAKLLNKHVYRPLMGLLFQTNETVEDITQVCMKKDQEIVKLKEQLGSSQNTNMFNVMSYNTNSLKSQKTLKCFSRSNLSLVDPLHPTSSNHLQKLYTHFMSHTFVEPQIPPPTPSISQEPLTPFPNVSSTPQQNHNSQDVQDDVPEGFGGFEEEAPPSHEEIIVESQTQRSSMTQEDLDKELTRRKELEEHLKEKALKEKQNQKKNKIKKLFV